MNIVLSRLDRMGDLILSTPAIASVRRSWPQARITIVCSAQNVPIVERSADVDDVHVLPAGVAPREYAQRFAGQTDLAIALAPCEPDFQLVAGTGARKRVGYTYARRYLARATARLFLTDIGISEADPALADRDPTLKVRHEVDQVLDLVTLAGGTPSYTDLVVPIRDEDRLAVSHVPAGAIAFHLAPRWFAHGATLANTIELIRDLRTFDVPLVVTYGPDAVAEAEAVRAADVADEIVGDLSFLPWAATFEKSRLVVTVDTGATHVASATRRPTVVLFEHRYFNLNSQEWSPYRVPSAILRKPAGDRPAQLRQSRLDVVAAVDSLLRPPVMNFDA